MNMTAAEFKAIRKRLGLKQVQWAEGLFADQAMVSRWESGKTPVPPRVAKLALFILKQSEEETNHE